MRDSLPDYNHLGHSFDSLLRGPNAVLGPSLKQNTLIDQRNAVKDAYDWINFPSHGAKDINTAEAIELTSKAFKLLHLYNESDKLDVIKKHETFIVKLIDNKNINKALDELTVIGTSINNFIHGSKLNSYISKDSLLSAIPYTSITDHTSNITNLIVTYYFLAFQCFLQYITIHLKVIIQNTDSMVSLLSFHDIVFQFRSSSEFSKWVYHSSDQLIGKYRKNQMKIIQGLMKVLCFLTSKTSEHSIKVSHQLLSLKLTELQVLQNDPVDHLPLVEPNHATVLFMKDLKQTCEMNSYNHLIPAIENHIAEDTSSHCDARCNDLIQQLKQVLQDPCEATINSISSSLQITGLPYQLWDLPEFITTMNSLNSCFLRSHSTLKHMYLNKIATMVISSMQPLQDISKDHIYFLDTLIVCMKELINREGSVVTIDAILSQLFSTLSTFSQWKRMRNISNLYFNLSKKHHSSDLWEKCLRFENRICVQNYTVDNLKQADAKMAKVAHILSSLVKSGNILENDLDFVMSRSLSEFNALMEGPIADTMKWVDQLKVPKFVHILVKHMEDKVEADMFNGLVGVHSVLNDGLRSVVYLNLLEHLEQSNNEQREYLINSATACLSLNCSTLQKLCRYSYLKVNGVSDFIDTELDPSAELPIESLFLCGIKLYESINNLNLEIGTCLKHFDSWYCTKGNEESNYEIEILKGIMKFLEHCGSLGKVNHVMKFVKANVNQDPRNLQLKLYCDMICSELAIRGGFNDAAETSLISSGETLKLLSKYTDTNGKLEFISSHTILQWKLLQLQHIILSGDIQTASSKLILLREFVASKPEFDLKYTALPIVDRFLNLISIAKLQLLACQINFKLHNGIDALGNCKLAIKLLYSVMKKLPMNISKVDYNDLKWRTLHLLSESYKQIIQLYKHLGISREIPYYLDELSKLNDSGSGNYIHCMNCHFIAKEFLFIDQLEASLASTSKSHLKFKDNDANINWLSCQNQILYHAIVSPDNKVADNTKLVIPRDSANWDDMHLNIPIDYHSLGIEFDYSISLIKMNATLNFNYWTNDKRRHFLKQFLKTKSIFSEKIRELKKLMNLQSPVWLPPQVNVKTNRNAQDIAEQLIAIKQSLFNMMNSEGFKHLDVHELRDFCKTITNCIQVLSVAAEVKPHSFNSLLGLLFYLQDVPRLLAETNEKLVSDLENHKTDSFIPSISQPGKDVDNLEMSAIKYMNDLKSLPSHWSIIAIDVSQDGEDLILSKYRYSGGSDTPTILKLTLDRFNDRFGENSNYSFSEVQSQLSSIIHRSNISTKSSTTSQIRTKEDRKRWWTLRFGLDMELKELLNTIESKWLGGFAGLFDDSVEDNLDLFSDFKKDFQQLWSTILLPIINTDSLLFNNNIVKLFYQFDVNQFGATEFLELDDLIYFIIEQLSMASPKMTPKLIDIAKVRNSLIQLIENYSQTRSAISKTHTSTEDHIVLVLGSKCNAIPWESLQCLRNKSVSRMPSVSELIKSFNRQTNASIIGDEGKLLYLINPGGDLARTESKFTSLFQPNEKIDMGGVIGHRPNEESFLDELTKSDLFVYLGHGGCEQYINTSSLLKMKDKLPPSLLIGCSSGQLQLHGFLEPSANIYNWLICGAPMVVANLWDVTDKDIDLFSHTVLDNWGVFSANKSKVNITEAVALGRKECTLKYLNGSAPVVYGLPLYLDRQTDI